MRFTEEHEQFRKSVRAVIESEINPYVDEWEAAGIFPAHELFPKLAKVGMFGLEYDPEFGGQGADHTFTVVLGEELGATAHCAGVPMAIAVQASMSTPALAKFGSDELKRTYLAPAMSGEMVTSVAVSEPDAGSDVAGIKTRAVRDGDDWVINGTKMWITSGTQADWICLLARTSDEGGYMGMSQIIVPTDTPGFSVGRAIKKMGNHSSDTGELVFEDVRVPVSNTVGEIGRVNEAERRGRKELLLLAERCRALNERRRVPLAQEHGVVQRGQVPVQQLELCALAAPVNAFHHNKAAGKIVFFH